MSRKQSAIEQHKGGIVSGNVEGCCLWVEAATSAASKKGVDAKGTRRHR